MRRRRMDRWPWRVLPLAGYLILAMVTAFTIGRVNQNVNAIKDLEDRTAVVVCERQREGLERLRETKTLLGGTNATLIALLTGIDPATPGNAQRFKLALVRLERDNAKLTEGIASLNTELARSCPPRP